MSFPDYFEVYYISLRYKNRKKIRSTWIWFLVPGWQKASQDTHFFLDRSYLIDIPTKQFIANKMCVKITSLLLNISGQNMVYQRTVRIHMGDSVSWLRCRYPVTNVSCILKLHYKCIAINHVFQKKKNTAKYRLFQRKIKIKDVLNRLFLLVLYIFFSFFFLFFFSFSFSFKYFYHFSADWYLFDEDHFSYLRRTFYSTSRNPKY